MAENIATIILKVDLDCPQCYKKIRKILCKLQDQEKIRTISFDHKSKTIIISGPFDPHKLSCKIRCKGGKVIKDIQIKESKPKEKPDVVVEPVPSVREKPKEKPIEPAPKEIPAEPAERPKEKVFDHAIPVVMETPKKKPVEKPCQPAIEAATATVEIPSWPAGLRAPCSCTPYYPGYYEGCRCCSCGRVYGSVNGPQLSGCYIGHPSYCGGYRSCHFFSEDDPSAACSIM